jgi:predicted nuclease of predicted toxin-antitoxin system
MKLLLDECIDVRLKNFIPDYEVFTVQEMQWLGKVNGELLRLTEKNNFDVFITIDKNLPFQQNVKQYGFAVVIFDIARSTVENLQLLIPQMMKLLPNVRAGEAYRIR